MSEDTQNSIEPERDRPLDSAQDKLERVERVLNQKDNRYYLRRRSKFGETDAPAHDDWHDSDNSDDQNMKKHNSLASKVFMLSVLFFVAAVAFGLYQLQDGGNVVSSQNVEMNIIGPLSIKGGEEFQLQLQIVNNNDVPLESSGVTVEFPNGTRSSGDIANEMSRLDKSFGSISPHQVINETIRAVLFGEENSVQTISATLTYRLPGSSALYQKPTVFKLKIDSAPVALSIESADEATSGDEITIDVQVESNTGRLIPGLRLKLNYPPGFTFVSASPLPINGRDDLWSLGDVSASSTRQIKITGVLTGQENDVKAFEAVAGVAVANQSEDIGLIYNSLFQTIELKRPFIGLAIMVGDSSDEIVAIDGDKPIRATFIWSNNTDSKLTDCVLTAVLSGVINRRTVDVDTSGVYFSDNNSVIWNPTSKSRFKVLDPGDSGSVTFVFSSMPLVSSSGVLKRPSIKIDSRFTCNKVGESDSKGLLLSAEESREMHVNSDAQLSSSLRYFTGPFNNIGPFPPVADMDTSYTVIWSLTNSSNDILGGNVRAMLPQNATWLSKQTGDGTVSYDPESGEVVWQVETLKAGVGYDSPVRQVAFQFSLRPAVTDIGSFTNAIGSATFTGIDDFTKEERKSIKSGSTTELGSDPGKPKELTGTVREQ